MTVVVYAIAEGRPAELDGVGVDGARLEAVTDGALTAVVSEELEPGGPTNPERLWQYERVIEGLMEKHPIVPVRYGSRLPERGDVASMLSERRDELTATVQRLRGTVELSVRAQYADEPERDRPQTGREYMLERVERHRRTEAFARRLEPLDASARASRSGELKLPAVGVHVAYLVDASGVEEFTDRLAELSSDLPDVELVCTGPWPPYTFAQGPQEAAR